MPSPYCVLARLERSWDFATAFGQLFFADFAFTGSIPDSSNCCYKHCQDTLALVGRSLTIDQGLGLNRQRQIGAAIVLSLCYVSSLHPMDAVDSHSYLEELGLALPYLVCEWST